MVTSYTENEQEQTRGLENLLAALRNSNGKPVYIAYTHDIQVKLVTQNVADVFDLETIHRELNNTIKTGGMFSKPIQPKAGQSPVIILSDDSDRKVKTQASRVFEILQKANIITFIQTATKNDVKAITCTELSDIRKELVSQYQTKYSTGGTITDFKKVINSNANTPAIQTGFERLDKVLDGGLYEGLYAIGAISSLGKTTFCLNIAEQIAESGQDVIIIALEMGKYSLISRSISRLTFRKYLEDKEAIKYEWCKTSRGITDGSRYANYSEAEKKLISDSVDYFAENIGKHLYIYEAIGDLTTDRIRSIVNEHLAYTGNRPVLIIDYLQLIQHEDKYINGNDKIRTDFNLTELKRLSRDYKLPIVAISSFNRAGYNTEVKLECFKESGGIDYTCDVIAGLQLAGVGKDTFDVTEAKAKDPREIELVFLKNREAAVGDKIKYYYYPKFNHFIESLEDTRGLEDFEADKAADMVKKIRNYHNKKSK